MGALKQKKNILAVLLMSSVCGVKMSWGQNSATAQTAVMPAIKQSVPLPRSVSEDSQEKFSMPASFLYGGNQFAEKANNSERSLTLDTLPSYNLTERLSLASRFVVGKEFHDDARVTINNIPLHLIHTKYRLFNTFDIPNRISVSMPTNIDSRDIDTFQASVGVGTGLLWKGSHLAMTYNLNFVRNIHEYTIGNGGTPNVQTSLNNFLKLDLSLTKSLTLSGSGAFRKGRTYGGFERDSFTASVDASYAFTKRLGVTAGMGNEGGALRANGRDSNLAFYNENTSSFQAGLEYLF